MSAFGGKADSLPDPSACPLIAISGHLQSERAVCHHGDRGTGSRWAAQHAAVYVHPRLAQQQFKGPDGGNIVVQVVRFTDGEEQAADEPEGGDDGANGVADSGGAGAPPRMPRAKISTPSSFRRPPLGGTAKPPSPVPSR